MNIYFDTETTGLPKKSIYGYKHLESYESCRLVSIAWIVTRQDKVVSQSYYIIKPEGFGISQESQAIHGISEEKAIEEGVSFDHAMQEFREVLKDMSCLIAHNIQFDSNVLKSEFYRRGMKDMIELMEQTREVCTMKQGQRMMKLFVYPKLGKLYEFLYNEEMKNAHDALYDTYHCFMCFKKMFPDDERAEASIENCIKCVDE
jgi:DNA polymerase III epsilon subunit-like protein